jgi:hypothetical protein
MKFSSRPRKSDDRAEATIFAFAFPAMDWPDVCVSGESARAPGVAILPALG